MGIFLSTALKSNIVCRGHLSSSWGFCSRGMSSDLFHSGIYERKGAIETMLCCLLQSRWLFDYLESLGSGIRLSCWKMLGSRDNTCLWAQKHRHWVENWSILWTYQIKPNYNLGSFKQREAVSLPIVDVFIFRHKVETPVSGENLWPRTWQIQSLD